MFLINGEFSESVSVRDRGLHYGDGLFETLAIDNGKPLCWDKHIERLRIGCQKLFFEWPGEKILIKEVNTLCKNSTLGVLKIILTRGEAGRGYQPPAVAQPTRILGLYPWPDYPAQNTNSGVRVHLCQTRLAINLGLAGIKHLNRLEQVLASNERINIDVEEGLVLDTEESVIEGTMSNLFLVASGKLITPDLSKCGICGIIRQSILDLAPVFGIESLVKEVKIDELLAADELFLCNSTIGVWSVNQLEDHAFDVGPWANKFRAKLIEQEAIIA